MASFLSRTDRTLIQEQVHERGLTEDPFMAYMESHGNIKSATFPEVEEEDIRTGFSTSAEMGLKTYADFTKIEAHQDDDITTLTYYDAGYYFATPVSALKKMRNEQNPQRIRKYIEENNKANQKRVVENFKSELRNGTGAVKYHNVGRSIIGLNSILTTTHAGNSYAGANYTGNTDWHAHQIIDAAAGPNTNVASDVIYTLSKAISATRRPRETSMLEDGATIGFVPAEQFWRFKAYHNDGVVYKQTTGDEPIKLGANKDYFEFDGVKFFRDPLATAGVIRLLQPSKWTLEHNGPKLFNYRIESFSDHVFEPYMEIWESRMRFRCLDVNCQAVITNFSL